MPALLFLWGVVARRWGEVGRTTTTVGVTSINAFLPRSFFLNVLVGTSLAYHNFPPKHRLLLLLAGPFQLFFLLSLCTEI